MNTLHTLAVLIVAFLLVYLEAAWSLPRRLLGCQVDLLPALVIYTALFLDLTTLALLAVLGGLWFDSFSANPLGVSVLPLFLVGFVVFQGRELVLRDLRYAQSLLGFAASAVVPLFTVFLIKLTGGQPQLGWASLWQWLVMAAAGAMAAPLFVRLFAWWQRHFRYERVTDGSFRPDREIKRGRA